MRFGEANYLHFLWGLIPLIFFMVWGLKKKRELIVKFCGDPLQSRLIPPGVEKRHKRKTVLVVLAIFFILMALTRPRWGYQWEDLHQKGVTQ